MNPLDAFFSIQVSMLKHLDIEADGVVRHFEIPSNLILSASAPEDRRGRLVYLLQVWSLPWCSPLYNL
jgi:hypothetical protein